MEAIIIIAIAMKVKAFFDISMLIMKMGLIPVVIPMMILLSASINFITREVP